MVTFHLAVRIITSWATLFSAYITYIDNWRHIPCIHKFLCHSKLAFAYWWFFPLSPFFIVFCCITLLYLKHFSFSVWRHASSSWRVMRMSAQFWQRLTDILVCILYAIFIFILWAGYQWRWVLYVTSSNALCIDVSIFILCGNVCLKVEFHCPLFHISMFSVNI
jgi:hypothetical protein